MAFVPSARMHSAWNPQFPLLCPYFLDQFLERLRYIVVLVEHEPFTPTYIQEENDTRINHIFKAVDTDRVQLCGGGKVTIGRKTYHTRGLQ